MNFSTLVTGQISPKMISAGKRLLFTESACFIMKDGIELRLPAGYAQESEIIFQFCFALKDEDPTPTVKVELASNTSIKIILTNFANALGTGTTSPLDFKIGNAQYYLLIYALGIKHKEHKDKCLINMTVSMYRDGI